MPVSTSNPKKASASRMSPAKMKPKKAFRRSLHISTILPNTSQSVQPCRKASCWSALPEPARRCSPKQLQVNPMFLSSPSPALNSWRCSSEWVLPKSVTCSSRPKKKHRALSSSMKLTPSAARGIRVRSAVPTTSVNRRSTSC